MTEKDLIFFNKEGDSLNFKYNDSLEKFEGNLLFHENSSDVFKTIGVYMFEKVKPFEYMLLDDDNLDKLFLDKFQLFNEYGINFSKSTHLEEEITFLEAVNDDVTFASKWIYGVDFDTKFPIGTKIRFDIPFVEFTNLDRVYTVIYSKKGAIQIISDMDNKAFNTAYNSILNDPNTYINNTYTISAVNIIGIKNYVDTSYNENLSNWSEPSFFNKYFDNQKLTIVNSSKNDSVVTIKNKNILDSIYNASKIDIIDITSDLTIEYISKKDVVNIYTGNIIIDSVTNTLEFISQSIPLFFKPGLKFNIPDSLNNNITLTMDNILLFDNTQSTEYVIGQQVIYENKIYENIQTYIQNPTDDITPLDSNYWIVSNFIPIVETLTNEVLNNIEIFSESNILRFEYLFDTSNIVTATSSIQKYQDVFKLFNIDLKIENNSIIAYNNYSGNYANVKFYINNVDTTTSFLIYENLIEVYENLETEYNNDISEINETRCVFSSIIGNVLTININNMVYDIDTQFVFTGSNIDIVRTLDKTLRAWVTKYYFTLSRLGIEPILYFTGNISSIYVNSIRFKSDYPNVPMVIDIDMDSCLFEQYYIPFYDLGSVLNISITGVSYLEMFDTDITTTLNNWVNTYSLQLEQQGIYVSSINQVLYIHSNIQSPNIQNLMINIGKYVAPGIVAFSIIKRFKGNKGCYITSNMIIHTEPNISFLNEQFATGMIIGIENSNYILNNQEYNILYIDENRITLSYQGPFWGNSSGTAILNAFLQSAFDSGFGSDPLANNVIVPIVPNYTFSDITSISNMVDFIHTSLNDMFYVLADDLVLIDANLNIITSVITPSIPFVNPIKIDISSINNYIYILCESEIYIFDTSINTFINSVSTTNASDIQVNYVNGKVYIITATGLEIYDQLLNLITTIPNTDLDKMTFHITENNLYISANSDLIVVDGVSDTIINTYSLTSITGELFYNQNNDMVYFFDNNILYRVNESILITAIPTVIKSVFHSFTYNIFNSCIYISTDISLYKVDIIDNVDTYSLSVYGYISYNDTDKSIYISNIVNNDIVIFSSITNVVSFTLASSSSGIKMLFSTSKMSTYVMYPLDNKISEIVINPNAIPIIVPPNPSLNGYNCYIDDDYIDWTYFTICGVVPPINISDNQYGTLDPDYIVYNNLVLKTREFIRKPRENYENLDNNQVIYKWHWLDDTKPDMFIYDFSGEYLEDSGAFMYKGVKPLPNDKIFLNREPNRNLDEVYNPVYQQTIFDSIKYDLDYIDSSTNISFVPEPLELFLGFKSKDEGVYKSTLLLSKIEEVEFSIITNPLSDNLVFEHKEDISTNEKWGEIHIDISSNTYFTSRNLRSGQLLQLFISDNTNIYNQKISMNNGKIFKIREVYSKMLVLDYIDSEIVNEQTTINNSTYMTTIFKVVPKVIGQFNVLGQTEIEDIRFKTELTNIGRNVTLDDIFIFDSYDINEQGVDWEFLNKKRKEMLMVAPDIFNYIGSYKAIINAINYFGYNDLELYEYYRYINRKSPNFGKLFKVEIPDIFNNEVSGWENKDFIKNTMPNKNFKETNLFNLTYKITDKEGNYVLGYSLDEVLIKLSGLKSWLKKNVIPLTHDILDITGRTDTVGDISITHENYVVTNIKVENDMTPVTFNINESYLLPINTGSSVFNVVLEPSVENIENIPDYYTINIRTYQIYKEWEAFNTYSIGDTISYLGRLYKSVINNNKLKNPRKYDGTPLWSANENYIFGQVVLYNRRYYQMVVLQGNVNTNPVDMSPFNNVDWLDITEWELQDMIPVQQLSEYRYNNNLLPFNFTIDSSIDPYVTVEVTSDNGYGQIYTVKKNYEIRFNADADIVLINI